MSGRLPVAEIEFITRFRAFALSRGDAGFDAENPERCALAQFGYPGVVCWEICDVPKAAYAVVCEVGGRRYEKPPAPVTFSALAQRLDALLADAPSVERVS